MIGNLQSGKSLIKNNKGESSILLVLLFTTILVFLILPIFAFVFDKAVVNLVSQDIVDEVQLLTLKIYPSFVQSDLSVKKVMLSSSLKAEINEKLLKLEIHPMIKKIYVTNIEVIGGELYKVQFDLELSLKPSLYREVIKVPSKYELHYTVVLPINK